MSYLDYDLSPANGSPVTLYRFTYDRDIYTYCDIDGGVSSVTMNGEVYTATTIQHSTSEMTPDFAKSSLEITTPRSFPVAKIFFLAPPENVITLTIMRTHIIDPALGYITVFKGRVLSCAFQEEEAVFHVEPIYSSLRRLGLGMVYDSQCAHGLYSSSCTVMKDSYKVMGSVLAVSASIVTVQAAATHANGWFTGGIFSCGSAKRMIISHVGTQLTLLHSVTNGLAGEDCEIYPGCSHLRSDCGGKFNNALNFGGFSWIPAKNPFSGDNIFF